jgi:hypothetical protein
MPQHLPPPRDPSKSAVRVWCPGRRRWLPVRSSHLRQFAVEIAELEHDIRHGFDSKPGNGDPTVRTPLDHLRTMLANVVGALACARRRLNEAEKKRRIPT